MRRTPTLAFLLVTVFVDMMGLGLIVPILPALMTTVTGHATTGARWSGVIDSSYGIAQFLITPALGRIADRYGRRPVLVLSLAFLGLNYLAHAAASHAWIFLLAHALAGAFAGSNIVVNAYIADIIEPAQRPRAYSLVGAAFSVGFVAGPAIGGLLGVIDLRLPFYVAAGLAFANAGYGLVILPESRRGDRQTRLHWRIANPISSIAGLLRRPQLRHLTIAQFLRDLARMIDQVVWIFFMITRFGWSTAHVGATIAGTAIAGAVVNAFVSARVIRRLGVRSTAIAGAILSAVAFAGYVLSSQDWMVYPCLLIAVLGGIGAPAMQTWISQVAGDAEQGTVQGAMASIGALAEATMPALALSTFAWSLTIGRPGFVLMVAALLTAGAAVLLRRSPNKLGCHELPTVAHADS